MPDAPPSSDTITQWLLERTATGEARDRDDVLALVYGELRQLAGAYLSHERRGHTLQPTALVHEVYLRLVDQRQVDWRNRAHFIGVAAVMMRRILVNYARDRRAEKRGGGADRVSLSAIDLADDPLDIDLIDLHDALDRLGALDPRKARIVELKFFGGLTAAEIADVLQVSHATVERDWSFARAWLYDALSGGPEVA
jgi:RNA polymerase sigma factor (TIGR02999 family)